MGQNSALATMAATGTTKEDFKDCSGGLPRIWDSIDDSMANFWDGYVENTATAFEKEVKTCPVAKQWSDEPEFCGVILKEFLKGVADELNPKFNTDGFSKLIVKGDDCCRYRFELKD